MISSLLTPWSSSQTIWWLNLILHSLAFSSIGWLFLRAFQSPHHRSIIAANAILLASLAPWITAMLPQESPPASSSFTINVPSPSPAPLNQFVWTTPDQPTVTTSQTPASTFHLPSWPACIQIFVALWLLGTLFFTSRIIFTSLRTLQWQNTFSPLTSNQLQHLQSQLPNLPIPFSIYTFTCNTSPCVVGLLRPRLAVPQHAFNQWTPAQWHWVLRHETTHLQHRDNLLHPFLQIMLALWWWNPFIHSIFGSWTTAREQICDAHALGHPDEAPSYAKFLIHIAETSCFRPNTLAMARLRPAHGLRQRLTHILTNPRPTNQLTLKFLTLYVFTTTSIFLIITHSGLRAAHTRRPQPAPAFTIIDRPSNTPDKVAAKFPKIYIETQWIEIKGDANAISSLPADEGLLTKNQYQQLISDLSQKKGINLMSAPSVSMNPGQRAIVEVIRETPDQKDFIGVRTDINSLLLIDQLALQFTSDLGEMSASGQNLLTNLNPDHLIDPTKIIHHRRKSKALFRDGETHCLKMGEPSPGRHLYHFITPKAITSDGKSDITFQQASINLNTISSPPLQPDPDRPLISITLQAVDLHLPLDHASDNLKALSTPPVPLKPNPAAIFFLNDLLPPKTPGLTSLAGVLTDDQFATIQKELEETPKAQIQGKSQTIITHTQVATLHLPSASHDQPYTVSAISSYDQKMIEFTVECPGDGGDVPRSSTSLTMWDRQTIVLYQSSQHPRSLIPRLIFITPEIQK